MSRRRALTDGTVPPLLLWLINAAKHSGRDGEGADLGGTPEALRELGALASWALPIHGVFVPNNSDISIEVERVSKAHLGLDRPGREFGRALKAVEPFGLRSDLESAHNHLRTVEDEAYYYAGLAFGIVLANVSGK